MHAHPGQVPTSTNAPHGGRYLHAAGIIHRDLKPSNMCAHAPAVALTAVCAVLTPAARADLWVRTAASTFATLGRLGASGISCCPPTLSLAGTGRPRFCCASGSTTRRWTFGARAALLPSWSRALRRSGWGCSLGCRTRTKRTRSFRCVRVRVSAAAACRSSFIALPMSAPCAHCRQMLGAPSEEDLSAVCDSR